MTSAAAVLVALVAFASAGDEGKARAAEHLAAGNAAFEGGRVAEALRAYEEAYALFPSPKIQMNIGEAHHALGDPVAAASAFERVVVGLPEDSPVHRAASERLAELRAEKVGRLTVTSAPVARATLDGAAIGETPIRERWIVVGRHELELSADAHLSVQRAVTVAPGETTTIDVSLPSVATPDTSSNKVWWWVGAGAVVVAAAVVVGVVATSGDDFLPAGELGRTSLDDWSRP